jgi:Na+/H+-dicarboxylate symporter
MDTSIESDYKDIPFSKAVVTAVFVGIIDTVICLIYNVLYRDSTGFPLSAYINVSTLIFAVNLLFLVVGIVYFAFIRVLPKGEILYIIVIALLTVFFIWKVGSIERSPVLRYAQEFRSLLIAILVIIGASAAFWLPWLYHSKKFEEHVL